MYFSHFPLAASSAINYIKPLYHFVSFFLYGILNSRYSMYMMYSCVLENKFTKLTFICVLQHNILNAYYLLFLVFTHNPTSIKHSYAFKNTFWFLYLCCWLVDAFSLQMVSLLVLSFYSHHLCCDSLSYQNVQLAELTNFLFDSLQPYSFFCWT